MLNRMKMSGRLCAWVVLLVLALPGAGRGQEEAAGKRLAVMPFHANAAKDISYLQNALREMLSTRLAATVGALIVPQSEIDRLAAEASVSPAGIATALRADYVVTGTMTALGKSLSLDAKVFVAAADVPPESFFSTAATEDEVIVAIDRLAVDIAVRVFGHQPAVSAAAPVVAAGIEAARPDQNRHPDRAFAGQGGGYQLLRSKNAGSLKFTKSQNFSLELRAMDVGDVDGDGRTEVVLAGANEVRVFRTQETGGSLQEIAVIPLSNAYRVHWVSVADTNGDGRAEIYVSAGDAKGPYSSAFEWNGTQFAEIFKGEQWYIRAMKLPGAGMVLVGQQADVSRPLRAEAHQLVVAGGRLEKTAPLDLPSGLKIFDIAYADLEGDGQAELVAMTKGDRLRVLRPHSSGYLWESDEYFGGTTRYIGEERLVATSFAEQPLGNQIDEPDQDRIYVPGRIVVLDFNKDGFEDVIVNKNLSTASRVMENLKRYPSGEIHGLTWDGIGLSGVWQTTTLKGYVADYQLVVDEEANTAVLYVGLVMKTGLTSSKSTVLTFPLALSASEAPAAR